MDNTQHAPPPTIPRATVRLQLRKGFGFAEAADLVPYFAELGISHLYTSPFLKARPGSSHGYDITDHSRFNPEIGDEAAFDRLVDTLRAHGMGLILDFVPNHMGIGGNDNPWWLDVLEWGQDSPYAAFFDINWSPAEPTLKGKVLLPFLGEHYGRILERGELELKFDAERGSFSVWYFQHRFPIGIKDYPMILRLAKDGLGEDGEPLSELMSRFASLGTGRRSLQQQVVARREADELRGRLSRLAADWPTVAAAIERAVRQLNGTPGNPKSFRPLHELLERQPYRAAYWRVAVDEINYRRFFDINDLAALQIENLELFEVSHQLVFRLIREGKLHGLRLDHIDGLYDPAEYCHRLQDRTAYLLLQAGIANQPAAAPAADGEPTVRRSHPLYLLVEKILARHEHLRADWPVDGTTGYEYMNLVGGLFVDPQAESALTGIYQDFIGERLEFEPVLLDAKRQILRTNLSSDLNVLATRLHGLARQSWNTRDFTLSGLRSALFEVTVQFPVYRTYITADRVEEQDRRDIGWAVAQARKTMRLDDESVLDFIHDVLTADLARDDSKAYRRRDVLRTALKFQQFTGPVMAKSMEDTAFYRYVRLVSLNEVGGEPGRFGVTPSAFHHLNHERLRHHPYSMLTTATHDHKRGEDVRARINVLSELASEWGALVQRWARMNQHRRSEADGMPAPRANDEYLIYQTLIGAWPFAVEGPDDPALAEFADRVVAYMLKAVREAKLHSSWAAPNTAYEQGVEQFVRQILDPARSRPFLEALLPFQRRIAVVGAVNGLAQTLLKLTSPGVPDLYQGTELWDLSLVDPDNRRPVDYDLRRNGLRAMREGLPAVELLRAWKDGRVKQHVIARALELRSRKPGVFLNGDYVPLEAAGSEAGRIVAFMRRTADAAALVVVPRLVAPLLDGADAPRFSANAWGDTAVRAPDMADREMANMMTGATCRLPADGTLRLADVLAGFPVALLTA